MDDKPQCGCREICQATRRGEGATGQDSTDLKYEPRATRSLPRQTPWEQGLRRGNKADSHSQRGCDRSARSLRQSERERIA
ncbi:hypothetical protein AVEN_11111-1 [Araneus ventricosus]|uniref:Uncharacterized protein n=1 Tax=Araneus ventricosus TaxID=182803 RepID=A0A4Y2KYC5_ARAVE|nr:hypothetical protein AVEN_11111-1 [Araneus ventricosus]